MLRDFRDFLFKQNALALAIGVLIGGALGKVVNGIVDDILMPLVGVVLPSGEWRSARLVLRGDNALLYGDLIGRVVDFLIVAFIVFVVTKAILREAKKPAASTKTCSECLEAIPLAARRCRACTSVQVAG